MNTTDVEKIPIGAKYTGGYQCGSGLWIVVVWVHRGDGVWEIVK